MRNFLCGTAFPRGSGADVGAALDTMLDRRRDRSPKLHRQAGASAAVAVAGAAAEKRVAADSGTVAAVAGSPYWADSTLSGLAADVGIAQSIIAAYRECGEAFLARLHGAFALALADAADGRLMLAVDRLGICQLYYSGQSDRTIEFGSAAHTLGAAESGHRELDAQAIYDYLYFHMVPSPGSIFRGVAKLEPGERAIWHDGRTDRRRYWRPDFVTSTNKSRTELADGLMSVMRRSVARRLERHGTGCFLSGGIDSSTIAGLVAELSPPAQTFTIGFDEDGYDETSFARITTEHFGTRQQEYFVTPDDVVDMLPAIAGAYDEPFGNSSVVPTYFCARMAQQSGINVLLAGDGGDELFGGNVRYVTQKIFAMYDKVPQAMKKTLIEPLAFRMPGASRFWPTRKLQSYIRQARVPMPERLETYNYLHRTPPDEVLESPFLDSIDMEGPLRQLRSVYNGTGATSMIDNMLALDWKFTLADNDLRKVVRMCDLAGVDVRFPFLDDELVEFSCSIPADLKIRGFTLRYFFKKAVQDFLPKAVLEKSKHGFGLPFGIWMKSNDRLRELAYDSINDFAGRGIVQPGYIDSLKEAHGSVHAHYYGEFIWLLMMLELWMKGLESRAGERIAA